MLSLIFVLLSRARLRLKKDISGLLPKKKTSMFVKLLILLEGDRFT